MNVDEAWRQLGVEDGLPREALQWSLDHWDEAAPRFISKLRAFAGGATMSDSDLSSLFFAVHLCGEKHEERAYVPLCECLGREIDLEAWLGEALTVTLPGILINVFDGDIEPLQRLYESAPANVWARVVALFALGYLVRSNGVMSDEAMRAYLSEQGARLSDNDPDGGLGYGWVTTIGALGYDTMGAEVARALSHRVADPELANIKTFHEDLGLSRQTPDGLEAFRRASVKPFESTIETLGKWGFAKEVEQDGPPEPVSARTEAPQPLFSDVPAQYEEPYVNPHRRELHGRVPGGPSNRNPAGQPGDPNHRHTRPARRVVLDRAEAVRGGRLHPVHPDAGRLRRVLYWSEPLNAGQRLLFRQAHCAVVLSRRMAPPPA